MRKPDISRLYTIFYKSALTIYRLLKYVDKYKRGPKFKLYKKIFETKYTEIFTRLNKKLTVIGDKAYVGLSKFNVTNPLRHNELLYKQDKTTANINNRALSTKRIQVEHVFARLKTYRILTNVYYYTTSKLDMFMKAICNIYNLTHKTA